MSCDVGRHAGGPVSQVTPTSRFPVMKAVVLTRTGGPDVLQVQDWPDPPVGAGEVRIAVRAAGVNFADTIARVGLYPPRRNGRASWATRSPARSRPSVRMSAGWSSGSE